MTEAENSMLGGGIVIVTGDGQEHRFVANFIAAHHPVRAILVCAPSPPRSWTKVLRAGTLRFLDRAMRRLLLRAVNDSYARKMALRQILGPSSEHFSERVEYVGPARSGVLEKAVASLSPDVLLIYGTSVIPNSVLNLPRRVALNMHTGISPRYRGTACVFWAIHNREPEWVGATIHECTSEVDGGRVFAIRHTHIHRDDTLHHIFARTVMVGAEAYLEVVDALLKGSLAGELQNLQEGREYRGSELGLLSELVARRHLRQLRRDWPV